MDNNCEKIRELISPYIDGEVTNDQRDLVDNHIKECAECKCEHDKMIKTVEMMRNSALSPENDLENAVFATIRSNARRNRFVRLGSTIAACFVLVVCISAFGVLELMHKGYDDAAAESANYAADYDYDQSKTGANVPSRALESNTEAEGYAYSAEGDAIENGSTSMEVESAAGSDDYLVQESLSTAEIEKYKSIYAPEIRGNISCVIISDFELDSSLDFDVHSSDADFTAYVLDFSKQTYGDLTSNLDDGDVVVISSSSAESDALILYVKLK